MATVAMPNKLGIFKICINNQIIKRIAYFDDSNLTWDYKISLNFTICKLEESIGVTKL